MMKRYYASASCSAILATRMPKGLVPKSRGFVVDLPYTNEQMLHFARRYEIRNSIPKAPRARWRDTEERKVRFKRSSKGLL